MIHYRGKTYAKVELTEECLVSLNFMNYSQKSLEDQIADQLNGRGNDSGVLGSETVTGEEDDPETYLESVEFEIVSGKIDVTIVVSIIIIKNILSIQGAKRGKIKKKD